MLAKRILSAALIVIWLAYSASALHWFIRQGGASGAVCRVNR